MPPNSTLSDKPVCVSDSFHFSSFYWRESNASLAGLADDDSDTIRPSTPTGRRLRSSTIGSDADSESPPTIETPVLKVRINLAFIAIMK